MVEHVCLLSRMEDGPVRIAVGVSVPELAGLQALLTQEIAATPGWSGIVDLWCVGSSIRLAAVNGDDIIGAASICFSGDGFCELHKLYVAPDWRNRGVARRLVNEVERVSREHEWWEIGVQISGDSEPFWACYLDGREIDFLPERKMIFRVNP